MAIETNELIDVKTLPPFKKFIMTIGNIPTSYLESMTYAELLMWFCNYLQETVIPTVNNNAEAVEELQNFVSSYFDNLDVQEEINKKLDEMAEDGTLTNLIKGYIDPLIGEQNVEISTFKSSVNSQINDIKKQVDGLATINPIPVDDLSDMTDTTKIYVYTVSGYWYYYDGSNWTSGGAYQTTVTPLNTISEGETTFFTRTDNRYDYHGLTDGLTINSNGVVYENASYTISDYCYIGDFQNDLKLGYAIGSSIAYLALRFNFYDIEKNYISTANSTSGTGILSIPANAAYCRFTMSVNAAYRELAFIVDSSVTVESLIPYGFTFNYTDNIIQQLTSEYEYPKIVIVDVNGSGDYISLKEGIEYAVQYENSIVYVKDGIYDLYQEFGGNDYFTEYDNTSPSGIYLSNNVHVIFSSNAKVVFNNISGNSVVDSRFSPFNAGQKGFILENLTIEDSKCRYSMHDEKGSSTDQYINKYINCNFKHDSTNGGYTAVIGGGLGKAGEVVIENCIFANPHASNDQNLVSYHNNNSATDTSSKSNVIIKDNYFKNGTIRISWCGVSTLISTFLVTNNRIKSAVIHRAERVQDVIENTELLAYNNIIE